VFAGYTQADFASLDFDWSFWGRPEQIAPPGNWDNWLILAGRGFGKTRTGAEWVRANMCGDTPLTGGRWGDVALVAETAADARDVMVGDGKMASDPTAGSGVLQVHPKDFRPTYEPSKRRLTWPNGAIATLYNAVEPDQLRGPQHHAAWCDELAKWQYAQDTWDQLQFGLRLGDNPQACITTTPRPILPLKNHERAGHRDNAGLDLAGKFPERIVSKYQGTRLGRQELDAEILEDLEGALRRRSVIDEFRRKLHEIPELQRIVVAIDPATSSEDESNETGIIVAGLGADGDGYVLSDVSGIYAPLEWRAKPSRSIGHGKLTGSLPRSTTAAT
jgi:phage terminase large subunit-like protein